MFSSAALCYGFPFLVRAAFYINFGIGDKTSVYSIVFILIGNRISLFLRYQGSARCCQISQVLFNEKKIYLLLLQLTCFIRLLGPLFYLYVLSFYLSSTL